MRKTFLCVLLASSFFYANRAEEGRSLLDIFLTPYRIFRGFLMQGILSSQRNKSHLNNNKFQEPMPKSIPFPCDVKNTRSLTKPKSVHKLKPGDIDVIGAMGDSLTVGFGLSATNIVELLLEERGKVFSIGGEGDWRTYTTLPNILKIFNSNLVGYSLSSSLSIEEKSQLNVAEIAAISANTPFMAKELINRIRLDQRINMHQDWKMITILIGSNDFCSEICYLDNPEKSLENHRKDLIEVLTVLRDNLPRTIVNLIQPPNLRILVDMRVNSFCDIFHKLECPCLFGLPFASKKNLLTSVMSQWQRVDEEVGNRSDFDRNDFTVVVHPFGLNYTFPTLTQNVADERYLSADCFHWSQRMHARVANDLWNSIMEPVGKKSVKGNALFKKFNCPTEEQPYIFTRRNS